eukprot:1674163-Heterocapsa_arctica.AAC.1
MSMSRVQSTSMLPDYVVLLSRTGMSAPPSAISALIVSSSIFCPPADALEKSLSFMFSPSSMCSIPVSLSS